MDAIYFGRLVAWVSTHVSLSEDDVSKLAEMVTLCLPAPAAAAPVKKDKWLSVDVVTEVISLLNQQKKIEAIKLVRSVTGLGLKEAKDLVEGTITRKPYYIDN